MTLAGTHRLAGQLEQIASEAQTALFTPGTAIADLEAAYETPELDTEAEVIVAFNATNAAINGILATLRANGLLASS